MKKSIEVYCFIDNFVKTIESKETKKLVGRKSALTKTDYIYLALFKQKRGLSAKRFSTATKLPTIQSRHSINLSVSYDDHVASDKNEQNEGI